MAQYFRYPAASGGSSSNASVGTNGATAPTSSTEVAGINPSGNLQPLQTDSSGNLLVSPLTSSSTVTVVQPTGTNLHAVIDSSALPSGAATAANQATEIASLASIDSKTPALGQALAAASVPVVLTAAQLTTLTPLTSVTVTQATGTNLHAVIDSGTVTLSGTSPVSGTVTANQGTANATPWNENIAQFGGSSVSLGSKVSASSMPVVIASDQGAVAISAASLPLPSGASTSALQTSGNSSLSSIDTKTPALGQALAAASVPVVLTAAQLTTLTPLTSVTVTQATGTNLHTVVDSSALPTGAATSANQTNGTQKTQISTPTALTVTNAAITVGTSAVRLTVSGSAPASTRVVLVATPDAAATATFYIGSATVTNSGATRGIEIVAGQSFIANNDAGDYYIVASIASQTVTVMEQA